MLWRGFAGCKTVSRRSRDVYDQNSSIPEPKSARGCENNLDSGTDVAAAVRICALLAVVAKASVAVNSNVDTPIVRNLARFVYCV